MVYRLATCATMTQGVSTSGVGVWASYDTYLSMSIDIFLFFLVVDCGGIRCSLLRFTSGPESIGCQYSVFWFAPSTVAHGL